MTPIHPSTLDETGAEQHRAALVYVTEAFAEAILAGIESDSFAHAALAADGEESVADFAERLPARLRSGEFSTRARH